MIKINYITISILIIFLISINNKQYSNTFSETNVQKIAVDTTKNIKIKDTFEVKQQMLEKTIINQNSKLDSIIKNKK